MSFQFYKRYKILFAIIIRCQQRYCLHGSHNANAATGASRNPWGWEGIDAGKSSITGNNDIVEVGSEMQMGGPD